MARGKFGTNTTIKLLGGELRVKIPGRTPRLYSDRAREIIDASEDLRPLFDEYGEYLLERIDKQFRFEGLPRRWAELKPETLADKRRKGYGSEGILQRTGRLRRGFRLETSRRTLRIINRRSVRGVNLFRVHQHGTDTIPARRMLVYTRVERARLTKLVREKVWKTE